MTQTPFFTRNEQESHTYRFIGVLVRKLMAAICLAAIIASTPEK